jgi:hypothetical protein
LQNHFLPPLGLAWYSHASRYGLNRSDAIFRIVESVALAGRGVIALLLGLPFVDFSRLLGRFRIP